MYLKYECSFCILNFTNRSDRKEHIKHHLKQKCCKVCDQSIIQIGDEWYEIRLHRHKDYKERDEHSDSDMSLNAENIKIEGIQPQLADLAITTDGTHSEDDCISIGMAEPEIAVEGSVKIECAESMLMEDLTDLPASYQINEEIVEDNEDEEVAQNNSANTLDNLKTSSEVVICEYCHNSFSSRNSLKRHMVSAHNLSVSFKCHACSLILQTKRQFLRHGDEVHEGRPFECKMCPERFKRNYDLTLHIDDHSEDFEVSCDLCEKKFKSKIALSRHLKLYSHTDQFKCKTCNKVLKTLRGLATHTQTFHEGKILYKCKTCGRNCSSKGNLTAHEKIHSSSRPFICSYCGKGFNQKANLNEHVNIHTGEKPYACNICGKTFSQKKQLVAHTRVHTRERPFKCGIDDCARAYINYIDLKRHRYSQHGVYMSKHICEICSKVFPEKKLLRKHMEKH